MVFELWEFDNGHSFFERASDEAGYRAQLRQYELDGGHARHVWTVEASTYNEAMQALYDQKGWGRYRTIEEELGETSDGGA
jgi:hypothetical protein